MRAGRAFDIRISDFDISYGLTGHRGREAALAVRRDPGRRALQRRPRPGFQGPGRAGPVGAYTALPAHALPQRLAAGDATALPLPDRPPRDARPDPAAALPAPARRADVVPVAAGLDPRLVPVGPGQ